jgi:hypothetical protein
LDILRATVVLHIVLGIVLTGQALFWFVMNVALRREYDPISTMGWLRIAQKARWPHVVVPWNLRLPLPLVGWLTLALLGLTGYLLLRWRGGPPAGEAWHLKMGAIAGMVVAQALMQRRPHVRLAAVNLLLAVLAMVAAALSIR